LDCIDLSFHIYIHTHKKMIQNYLLLHLIQLKKHLLCTWTWRLKECDSNIRFDCCEWIVTFLFIWPQNIKCISWMIILLLFVGDFKSRSHNRSYRLSHWHPLQHSENYSFLH
jgi:hypothetical protein